MALERSRDLKLNVRRAKEKFFRAHVAEIYDAVTDGCTAPLRVSELSTP